MMSTEEHEMRHISRRSCSPRHSVFSRIRRDLSRSPRQNSRKKEGGVFKRLGNRGRSVSARLDGHNQRSHSRVWFDDLLTESKDSYDDLKKAFLENYLQPKKCIKDPIELHNIKQRDGESIEDFVRRYKLKSMDVKGAPECMRISAFVYGITNPKLIKRLHDKIPKTVNEMMRVATSFPRREVAASNHERKKSKKEIQSSTTNDDSGREVESHQILKVVALNKRVQTNSGKEQPKATKKGETSGKDKALAILMVQPWERVARSQETVSSSVNSSRNVEAPGRRRSNYPKKQQGCSAVMQKKRGQAADRNQAIQEEVGKLVEAGFMKEVHYHDWLSNPVMRLVDKAFHKQIGRNLEVYVDDLIIKSRTKDEIVRDIEETFKTLREINMKLNPKKCTFGVEEGMFLGYKFSTKGLKYVQTSGFHWTTEAEEAFTQMKWIIAELPTLTAPMEKEELIVYLAAAKETLSAVLMTEREAKQMPFYFVSRALRGPKINYTSMEKLVLALVHAIERPEEDSPDTLMEVEEKLLEPWILFTDGSSCTNSSGARLILTNPEGMEFTYALRFRFDATNNEAKYEALTAGLRIAEQMGVHFKQTMFLERYTKDPVACTKAHDLSYQSLKDRPFYKRGIDIAGAFLEGPGKVKFLIVAIDYFTKWIEAKPITTINGNQVKKFMWDNIVCRFGLSGEIISDNGKQFWDNPFKDCNGDTPFSLEYGTKAVIPAEIGMPTLRTVEVDLVQNNKALEINLDLLEEQREQAAIREAKSKAKMEKYYNSKARNTSFKSGNLVYHNNDASRA
nr:reverse transcriptase domain-containing protein [Tanacetum cinerariifolium]